MGSGKSKGAAYAPEPLRDVDVAEAPRASDRARGESTGAAYAPKPLNDVAIAEAPSPLPRSASRASSKLKAAIEEDRRWAGDPTKDGNNQPFPLPRRADPLRRSPWTRLDGTSTAEVAASIDIGTQLHPLFKTVQEYCNFFKEHPSSCDLQTGSEWEELFGWILAFTPNRSRGIDAPVPYNVEIPEHCERYDDFHEGRYGVWDRDTTITESGEASEPAFDKVEALKQVETFLFRDIETGDDAPVPYNVEIPEHCERYDDCHEGRYGVWDRDATITESGEASEPAFDKAEALKQVETFLFRDIETGDEKDMDCSVDPTLWTMAAVGALQDDEKKAEAEGIKPRRVISKAQKDKEESLSSFLQARRKALDELHVCADFAPGQVAPREHQEPEPLGWASAGSTRVFGTRPPRGERRPLTESMKEQIQAFLEANARAAKELEEAAAQDAPPVKREAKPIPEEVARQLTSIGRRAELAERMAAAAQPQIGGDGAGVLPLRPSQWAPSCWGGFCQDSNPSLRGRFFHYNKFVSRRWPKRDFPNKRAPKEERFLERLAGAPAFYLSSASEARDASVHFSKYVSGAQQVRLFMPGGSRTMFGTYPDLFSEDPEDPGWSAGSDQGLLRAWLEASRVEPALESQLGPGLELLCGVTGDGSVGAQESLPLDDPELLAKLGRRALLVAPGADKALLSRAVQRCASAMDAVRLPLMEVGKAFDGRDIATADRATYRMRGLLGAWAERAIPEGSGRMLIVEGLEDVGPARAHIFRWLLDHLKGRGDDIVVLIAATAPGLKCPIAPVVHVRTEPAKQDEGEKAKEDEEEDRPLVRLVDRHEARLFLSTHYGAGEANVQQDVGSGMRIEVRVKVTERGGRVRLGANDLLQIDVVSPGSGYDPEIAVELPRDIFEQQPVEDKLEEVQSQLKALREGDLHDLHNNYREAHRLVAQLDQLKAFQHVKRLRLQALMNKAKGLDESKDEEEKRSIQAEIAEEERPGIPLLLKVCRESATWKLDSDFEGESLFEVAVLRKGFSAFGVGGFKVRTSDDIKRMACEPEAAKRRPKKEGQIAAEGSQVVDPLAAALESVGVTTEGLDEDWIVEIRKMLIEKPRFASLFSQYIKHVGWKMVKTRSARHLALRLDAYRFMIAHMPLAQKGECDTLSGSRLVDSLIDSGCAVDHAWMCLKRRRRLDRLADLDGRHWPSRMGGRQRKEARLAHEPQPVSWSDVEAVMQRRIKDTGDARALHLDLSDEDFLGEWSTRSLPEDLRALSLRQPSHDFLKHLPEGLDKLSLEFRRLRGDAPLPELPGSLSELNLDMAGCRSGLMFRAERIPKSVTRLTVDISGCNQPNDFMNALREALPPSLTLFSLRMAGCTYLFDSGLKHLRERLPSSLTTLALNFDACRISNEGLCSFATYLPRNLVSFSLSCAHIYGIRDASIQSLCDALGRDLVDFSLNLAGCFGVTDRSVETIGGILSTKLANFQLTLSRCPGVTDACLKFLSSALSQGGAPLGGLSLDFKDCPNISGVALDDCRKALAVRWPDLHVDLEGKQLSSAFGARREHVGNMPVEPTCSCGRHVAPRRRAAAAS